MGGWVTHTQTHTRAGMYAKTVDTTSKQNLFGQQTVSPERLTRKKEYKNLTSVVVCMRAVECDDVTCGRVETDGFTMAWGTSELRDHLADHALAKWLAWVAAAAAAAAADEDAAARSRERDSHRGGGGGGGGGRGGDLRERLGGGGSRGVGGGNSRGNKRGDFGGGGGGRWGGQR